MTQEQFDIEQDKLNELKRAIYGCCFKIGWYMYQVGSPKPVDPYGHLLAGWVASRNFDTLRKLMRVGGGASPLPEKTDTVPAPSTKEM